ncbi:hypothetical protein ACP70R_007536 [Stipagrostis hirtigluma subsp. patula]
MAATEARRSTAWRSGGTASAATGDTSTTSASILGGISQPRSGTCSPPAAGWPMRFVAAVPLLRPLRYAYHCFLPLALQPPSLQLTSVLPCYYTPAHGHQPKAQLEIRILG